MLSDLEGSLSNRLLERAQISAPNHKCKVIYEIEIIVDLNRIYINFLYNRTTACAIFTVNMCDFDALDGNSLASTIVSSENTYSSRLSSCTLV